VSDGYKVYFRRQLVGRVAPVAIGKDAQTTGCELLDLVLDIGKVPRRVFIIRREGLRQLGGLFGVGLESVDDVDPIECVQVIEVDHVILHVLGGQHDVADELSGRRHRDAERIFDRADTGQGVNRCAYSANTFGDGPGVAGIAADEDLFETADHCSGAESVSDDTVFHHRFNAQMAFNAGYRCRLCSRCRNQGTN